MRTAPGDVPAWMKAAVATIVFTVSGGALNSRSDGLSPSPEPPELARFITVLEGLRQQHRIPGLSVAVLKDQEVILSRGMGLASVEDGSPATPQTPYDIASLTKPLSAVVALKLVEEGMLDLERPIASYSRWTEFCSDFSREPSPFAKDLRCDPAVHTLRHLLSHTATRRPGEHFSYNPVLFSWASRPISAASGSPFSALVERYVFEPADMRRSARRHRGLELPPDLAADLAPPHLVDPAGAIVRAPPPAPQGDGAGGGVVSTVEDLAKFDVALDRGRLISGNSRTAMMTRTRNSSGEPLPYGLGWFIQEHDGHTLVWHSGWWEQAYSALYLKVPGAGLTLILLANSEGLWWNNPLERAEVDRSPFAAAFIKYFLAGDPVLNPRAWGD